ncbi:MAG: sensor histidine kinase, partial [Ruminococcus sp.]
IRLLSILTQMGAFLFLMNHLLKIRIPFFAVLGIEFAVQTVISLFSQFVHISPEIQLVLQFSLAFGGIIIFFKGTLKIKIIALFLQFIIAMFSSLISSKFIALIMQIRTTIFTVEGKRAAVSQLLTSDILMIIIFAVCYFLLARSHDTKNTGSAKTQMPVFTVIMIVHYGLLTAHYSGIPKPDAADLLMNYIFQSIIILSLYMQYFSVCRNIDLMEKNYLLSVNQFEQESEKRYYELAQSRFDEISKIRHDLNNHLDTALHLIKDNQQNEAREIMERLRTSLDGIKAVQYCENPVINTILTTKANQSEYKVIDMQFVLKDCDKIPCDSAELCSLISNLFDNAARAALESGTEPMLQIESGIVNEYFVLTITNNAKPEAVSAGVDTPTGKKASGHGYGMKIVRMIAEKYYGSFTLEQDGEFVTGTVMLQYR